MAENAQTHQVHMLYPTSQLAVEPPSYSSRPPAASSDGHRSSGEAGACEPRWPNLGAPIRLIFYKMGPPRYVCWFINHEITPSNYRYIYHRATEIRQLNAILGAPSCTIMSQYLMTSLSIYRMINPSFESSPPSKRPPHTILKKEKQGFCSFFISIP